MTSVIINLEGDALREATTQAMVSILSQEAKDKLVAKAIRELLVPSGYGSKKSPLEDAFEIAIQNIAREECVKHVKEDPLIRQQITDLMVKVSAKILSSDLDKMADRMASSFVDSLKYDR